ncbi:MAG: bifunctional metallophosphatase/5'-nucleotidase, partial [Pseudomonadota bacterium]
MLKKIILTLLLLSPVYLLNMLLASTLSSENHTKHITFLHFNDFYEINDQYGRGGLFLLNQQITKQKYQYPNALISFAGDLLSPSLYSSVSKGQHMIDALNLLNIDIAVPGNHEFDFGLNNAQTQFSHSKFPWIISNLSTADFSLLSSTSSSYIREVNGLKIGFFGLITPELAFLSRFKSDVIISDIINTAKREVAILKQQNVDLIVALTHLTLQEDRQLAQQVSDINLILGGHDHFPVSLLLNNTLIFKSGMNAQYLGVIHVFINPDKIKSPPEFSWQLIPTSISIDTNKHKIKTSNISQSGQINDYLKNYQLQLNKLKSKHLAVTDIELDARTQIVRSGESGFANLIADALKQYYKTDITLINGGGIRSDKIYPAASSLTTKDILEALPFNNKAVVVKLSGQLLLE